MIEDFARARIVPDVDMPVQHADGTVLRASGR
jgi:hypothetical protein